MTDAGSLSPTPVGSVASVWLMIRGASRLSSDLATILSLAFPRSGNWPQLIGSRKAPIKAVLLDQSTFAGVGNWIADEVLYQAAIRPQRKASGLSKVEVGRLRSTLLRIIRRAVAVNADSDRFPRAWLFHRRWGRVKNAKTVQR